MLLTQNNIELPVLNSDEKILSCNGLFGVRIINNYSSCVFRLLDNVSHPGFRN